MEFDTDVIFSSCRVLQCRECFALYIYDFQRSIKLKLLLRKRSGARDIFSKIYMLLFTTGKAHTIITDGELNAICLTIGSALIENVTTPKNRSQGKH